MGCLRKNKTDRGKLSAEKGNFLETWSSKKNQELLLSVGVPKGIRTPVAGVKGHLRPQTYHRLVEKPSRFQDLSELMTPFETPMRPRRVIKL
jgi:hypothetical protein